MRSRREPTPRQLDVLRVIATYRAGNGQISPTYREIGQIMGLHVSTVGEHLEALRQIGLIVEDVAQARSAIPTDLAGAYL